MGGESEKPKASREDAAPVTVEPVTVERVPPAPRKYGIPIDSAMQEKMDKQFDQKLEEFTEKYDTWARGLLLRTIFSLGVLQEMPAEDHEKWEENLEKLLAVLPKEEIEKIKKNSMFEMPVIQQWFEKFLEKAKKLEVPEEEKTKLLQEHEALQKKVSERKSALQGVDAPPSDEERKELEQFVQYVGRHPEYFQEEVPSAILPLVRLSKYPDIQLPPHLQDAVDFWKTLSTSVTKLREDTEKELKEFGDLLSPEGMKKFAGGLQEGPDWKKNIDESLKTSKNFRVQTFFLLFLKDTEKAAEDLSKKTEKHDIDFPDMEGFKQDIPTVSDEAYQYLKQAAAPHKSAALEESTFLKVLYGVYSEEEPDGQGDDPEGEDGDKDKPKKRIKVGNLDVSAIVAEAEEMETGELFKKLFEQFKNIISAATSGEFLSKLGFGGPQISTDKVQGMTVDIEGAEQKEYTKSEAKAVEFITNALNLDPEKNFQDLLMKLQNTPSFSFRNSKDEFLQKGNARIGDLLFFQKKDADEPYLAAVVSQVEPKIMMKYMEEDGTVYEEEVQKSPMYENEWLGFVKIPDTQKPDDEEVTVTPVS